MLSWGNMKRGSISWGKHEKREYFSVPAKCSSEQEAFVRGDKPVLEPRAVPPSTRLSQGTRKGRWITLHWLQACAGTPGVSWDLLDLPQGPAKPLLPLLSSRSEHSEGLQPCPGCHSSTACRHKAFLLPSNEAGARPPAHHP